MREEAEVKDYFKMWVDSKNNLIKKVSKRLEYGYHKTDWRRDMIIEALAFWKFIHQNFQYYQIKERREFLDVFTHNENYFVATVAMVESMPTLLWRKILWRYNINFSSFEAFLRRLKREKYEEIFNNYLDLFKRNAIPRAFSLFDRRKNKITVEKLLNEDSAYKRYSKKGSWSYNLLKLNFGFNEYPHGKTDDTKIVEISPLKFISVKNHADEFVVNQEDGKYWMLYQKARSNYAWMWDKTIKLKDYICPGFWYTLIVHLAFWFLSPIACANLGGHIVADIHMPWWKTILYAIPALLMPIWLITASGRFFLRNILTEETREAITDSASAWLKKHKGKFEKIGRFFAWAIIIFFATVVIGILLFLYDALGILGPISVLTILSGYLGYKLYYRDKHEYFPKLRMFPRWLKITLASATAVFTLNVAYVYFNILAKIWAFAIMFIKDIMEMFWGFIMAIGLLAIFVVIPFIIIFLMMAVKKFLSEKQQTRILEVFYKFGYHLFSILLGVCIATYIGIIFKVGIEFTLELAIAFITAFFLTGLAWYLSFRLDPQSENLRYMKKYSSVYSYEERETLSSIQFYRNKWLKSMDYQLAKNKVEEGLDILRSILGIKSYLSYDFFIPKLSEELMIKLKGLKEEFEKILDPSVALETVKNIVKGNEFEEAKIMAERKIIRNKNIWDKTKKISKVIFYPLIIIWKLAVIILTPIGKLISIIWEYAITIPRLIKRFNQSCPSVESSESISLRYLD